VTRVIEGLKLGHYAILGALLPALSKGGLESRNNFRKMFILLISTSGLFAIMLVFISNPLIQILFGADFLPASGFLPILGWSLLPYTISSFISYDLIARGREDVIVKSAFLSLLIYIILYVILIPAFGLSGAVWSAFSGEWIQGVIFLLFYKPVNMAATHEPR
jgi:O-antigen/teichoic acid export membrane protein